MVPVCFHGRRSCAYCGPLTAPIAAGLCAACGRACSGDLCRGCAHAGFIPMTLPLFVVRHGHPVAA